MKIKNQKFLDIHVIQKNHNKKGLSLISLLEIDFFSTSFKLEENFINDILGFLNEMNNDQKQIDNYFYPKYKKIKQASKPNEIVTESWQNYELQNLKSSYIEDVRISKVPLVISFKKKALQEE